MRDLLRFHAITLLEEYNLCDYPVDLLSFDNIFLESDITEDLLFEGKRTGILHEFTMVVDPEYKYI